MTVSNLFNCLSVFLARITLLLGLFYGTVVSIQAQNMAELMQQIAAKGPPDGCYGRPIKDCYYTKHQPSLDEAGAFLHYAAERVRFGDLDEAALVLANYEKPLNTVPFKSIPADGHKCH